VALFKLALACYLVMGRLTLIKLSISKEFYEMTTVSRLYMIPL
jgi:hypothetical protein